MCAAQATHDEEPAQRDVKNELTDAADLLDRNVREQAENGRKKLIVRVSSVASKLGINERTLRQRGFPDWFDANVDACTWKRWTGLVIDVEAWVEERGLEVDLS